MSYLRYFMPLVIEAQSRNIECKMFIRKISKYTNAYLYNDVLTELKSKCNVGIYDVDRISEFPSEVTFLLEGSGIEYINYSTKKIVLVGTLDFTVIYDSYIDKVDYVIFPSEFIEKYYGRSNVKNLCIGSPKYDIELDREYILKKYGLGQSKNALIIFPKTEDLLKIDMKGIYNSLHGMGYKIVVKTRGKDKIPEKFKGDLSLEDFSWFPHSTMELISVADVIVNFDSAACKECVMLRSPFINFSVKTESNRFVCGEIPFKFLYGYDYCINFEKGFKQSTFEDAVNKLISNDYDKEFDKSIKTHMHNGSGTSKKILDIVLK